MAGASSQAAAVAAVSGSPSSPKSTNTKWNEEAHRALIGTLLDVMDSSDKKWRAHLDLMVENMEGRGQQFSREGIRVHFLFSISKGEKAPPNDKQRHAPTSTTSLSLLKMPTAWDATRERDLLEEIYFVLSSRQSLSQEDKDAVVEGMQQRGYANLKWNAIR
ncbi:hypothetical protein KVR01_010056 [Diaporthe batatas]|uniref:uncharacterized protein n=1 Tax=Diaporthe batatas TaxID=748121 RepID=UPI001D03E9BF|nr:uncharacterized protein KVR01_010056 [Diaporthe batatas]KAG8160520.1 hypothetical protein KVR01_010056 [Diaporthe batatas]